MENTDEFEDTIDEIPVGRASFIVLKATCTSSIIYVRLGYPLDNRNWMIETAENHNGVIFRLLCCGVFLGRQINVQLLWRYIYYFGFAFGVTKFVWKPNSFSDNYAVVVMSLEGGAKAVFHGTSILAYGRNSAFTTVLFTKSMASYFST